MTTKEHGIYIHASNALMVATHQCFLPPPAEARENHVRNNIPCYLLALVGTVTMTTTIETWFTTHITPAEAGDGPLPTIIFPPKPPLLGEIAPNTLHFHYLLTRIFQFICLRSG